MWRVWSTPLLKLVVAGAAIFGAVQALSPRDEGGERQWRVELTPSDLRAISGSWIGQGRGAPSDEEMKNLVEARVREEILYREALALGLGEGDAIVRQRLAQKMEFLVGDVASLHEPTADELRAWYAANTARFAVPARATLHQIYFSRDRRGARAYDDAAAALVALGAARPESAEAAVVGDPTLVAPSCTACSSDEIAARLGPAFAAALAQLPRGSWAGPVESGYGWHLVWIDALLPEHVPALAEVEPEVRIAWTAEREDEIRRQAYAAIRERYQVVLPALAGARAAERKDEP